MVAQVQASTKQAIAAFCERNGIRWLAALPAAPNGWDVGPAERTPLLYEFEPGRETSLIDVCGYEIELEGLLKRAVVMDRPRVYDADKRDRLIRQAETLYGSQ